MSCSVAIIGLGKIGMLYDLNIPNSILSHSRAFFEHPEFEIIGGVDKDNSLKKIFTNNYKASAYSNVSELLKNVSPELIVVSTPTNTHLKIIQEIFEFHTPKIILCEKPIAYSIEESESIIDLCNLNGSELFINYIRRCDPALLEIRSRILSGELKMPFKAVNWYSKGLIHTGSHFLDVMTFWFGKVKSVELLFAGKEIGHIDAEPDFRVDFNQGSAIFYASDAENFYHYSMEIVTSNGRLRYEHDGKVSWQKVQKSLTLGADQLDAAAEIIENASSRYQYNVAEHINSFLQNKDYKLCKGIDDHQNMIWIHEILKQRKS